ncbi:SapC family protein [Cognaticolwellia beringensis]|uniref:SapC family protein n=1 Tax=Cognaticolwellia beringensis TaxID=1967665 RepID=A0A222GAC4_9GAMM|nr:SapC family protein [Cognaticolwellia beringensis]ASP48846.1 hypothetical protein B5D82_14370 [Cognaticolwellia beringensis]
MMKLARVSSLIHKDLRVDCQDESYHGKQVHLSHIVMAEIVKAAQYFPIFFAKDSDTGQLQCVALFGLNVDENLYQVNGLWTNCYIPLKIISQPFYLINDEEQEGSGHHKPCLAIDLNDPRVQIKHGERLFTDELAATPYLQQQASHLSNLTQGFILNCAFVEALSQYDLIEPLSLEIKYNNGQENNLTGLYTLNKQMLKKLPKAVQGEFERKGYVEIITSMLSSMGHMKALINLKNNTNLTN